MAILPEAGINVPETQTGAVWPLPFWSTEQSWKDKAFTNDK